ncbi:Chemotaxis protein CheY [compost metagenome]
MVLDIGLAGMDGIQVLKKIRQLDPHAKVVMCSGRGTPEMVQECLGYGAVEFVAKPFLPHVLADAVAAALQSPAL